MQVRLQVPLDNAVCFDIGNISKERQAKISFHIVLGLDGIIEVINKERQAQRNGESAENSEEKREDSLGLYRFGRHVSRVDNSYVVIADFGGQFCLLHAA